jgi:hypothetical protein
MFFLKLSKKHEMGGEYRRRRGCEMQQRFRSENLVSRDNFGNIKLSYDDNIKQDL